MPVFRIAEIPSCADAIRVHLKVKAPFPKEKHPAPAGFFCGATDSPSHFHRRHGILLEL